MKKIFIGNISYRTSEDTLLNTFGVFESILSVKIIRDKISGQSRGFGFVVFAKDDDAIQAIETIDGYELDGKELIVKEALPKKNKGQEKVGIGGQNKHRGRGFYGRKETLSRNKKR